MPAETAGAMIAPMRRALLVPLLLIAALGLALRIAAARGGLWLDEAWSAVYAHEAGSPAKVIFAINHDNNHILNTLWLQLVGWGASPLLSRALSIACGSGAILVAGLIGARRSLAEGLVTAALFAFSPLLLVYGSEARGYAPMLLAFLAGVLLVDRWLADADAPPPSRPLAWLAAIGTLAHVTMVVGLAVLTLWIALSLTGPWAARIRRTARAIAPALLSAMAVLAVMALAAFTSPAGFRVGSVEPFVWSGFISALSTLLRYAFAIPAFAGAALLGWAALAVLLALVPFAIPKARRPFYACGILLLPLAVGLLHVANSTFPRYFLVPGTVLLLLAGEALGLCLRRRSGLAALGGVVLVVILAGCAWGDAAVIADRRGDPAEAIEAMAARSPDATVALAEPRSEATLEVAAAARHYPIEIAGQPCQPAPFLYAEADDRHSLPAATRRCGRVYRRIAAGASNGLSGLSWSLYEASPAIR